MKPMLLYVLFFMVPIIMVAQSKRHLGELPTERYSLIDENTQQPAGLIVQLRQGADVGAFLRHLDAERSQFGQVKSHRQLSKRLNIHLVSFDFFADNQLIAEKIQALPAVVSATWDASAEPRATVPNDTLFPRQWDMERIGLPKVWDYTTGGTTAAGREIVVAILDSGFDLTHPEIQGNIWANPGEIPFDGQDNDDNDRPDDVAGWNFEQNSPLFSVKPHGTSVIGIIGAKGDNVGGIAGVNWDVKMMLLQVYLVSEIIEALDYVLEMRLLYNQTNGQKGAFIVVTNTSLGLDTAFCEENPIWGQYYDLLGNAGVLSVAATTNNDWDIDKVGDMPTSCSSDFILTVTNTDSTDRKAVDAAYGKTSIDIGAPGVPTTTISIHGNYNYAFGGTSSASPHVAGSVALLYSLPCTLIDSFATANPAGAALLMKDAILYGADPVYSLADKTVTGGRLNTYNAMKYLHSFCISTTEERMEGDFEKVYLGSRDFVKLFPNPVGNELHVRYRIEDFKEMQVRVFNVLGQEMQASWAVVPMLFEAQEFILETKDWAAGTYFINIFDKSRGISAKFVKQ